MSAILLELLNVVIEEKGIKGIELKETKLSSIDDIIAI